jgi:hypothetical protein
VNFLKKLLGGGSAGNRDGNAMYFYVKLHRCEDIIRVRVDMNNELSLNDDSSGYWARKMVSGSNYKCSHAELNVYFDVNRNLQNTEIQGGQLVKREDYESWLSKQQA